MEDRFNQIIDALKQKATVKQAVYRTTLAVFEHLKEQARKLANEAADTMEEVDKSVIVEFRDVDEFEFHLKFSGDLLVFSMHSNVIRFSEEHILFKHAYIQENMARAYFGQILVYNFMADTIKYNRLNDPGYLVARFLVNVEGKFYIEGERQMSFLFPDISQNNVAPDLLRWFIESSMISAVNADLIAPNFQQIQVISLHQKQAERMIGNGQKLGFQMKVDSEASVH